MHASPEAVAVGPASQAPVAREGNIVTAIAAAIFLWLGISVAASAYSYMTQEPGGPNRMYDGLTDWDAVQYAVFNTAMLVGAPVLWLLGRSGYRMNAIAALAELGFRDLGASWRHIGWILPVKLGAVVAFIALATLGMRVVGIEGGASVDGDLTGLSAVGIVLIAVAAGVSEEAMFRGFLMPRIGLAPQAMLFGLVHIGGGSLEQVALATVGGVVYGLGARLAKSIWPCVIAHAAWDIAAFTLAKGVA